MLIELQSFKRQQLTFTVLNLIALSTLLLIHVFFVNHFGLPKPTLVVVLGCAFLLRAIELVWAQSRSLPLSRFQLHSLTWASIVLNLGLAFVAAVLTNRPDSQYFVLLVMPVIEAASSFGIIATSLVIVASGGPNFFWISVYALPQPG